jgi:hypothetical protein
MKAARNTFKKNSDFFIVRNYSTAAEHRLPLSPQCKRSRLRSFPA